MKRISHQILIDSPLESTQITLKDVGTSTWPKHLNEQTDISRIDLKHIILGIPLHWQTSDVSIIATADDAGILQPLQRSQISITSATWLHLVVLELLIFLLSIFSNDFLLCFYTFLNDFSLCRYIFFNDFSLQRYTFSNEKATFYCIFSMNKTIFYKNRFQKFEIIQVDVFLERPIVYNCC